MGGQSGCGAHAAAIAASAAEGATGGARQVTVGEGAAGLAAWPAAGAQGEP